MTNGVKLYIHHCKRCDSDWSSKSENPKRCGRCKSPYWDRERKVRPLTESLERVEPL